MPQQMNPSQARVVDPVLTTYAHGYEHPQMVGSSLFPEVPVTVRGGSVIKFDRRSFLLYKARRSPGSNTKRVQIGYTSGSYGLSNNSLEGLVPDELLIDAQEVPNIDLGREAVAQVMDMLKLGLEYEQASLARDASAYDADHREVVSGSDQWSDPSSPDPSIIIKDAKEVIRRTIGMRPNTLLLSAEAFNAACRHPSVKEQFKYTSSDSITASMLANYFFGTERGDGRTAGRILVGDAVYAESEDEDAQMVDIWGKDAILAYVPMTENQSRRRPAYGYTYKLRNHPVVEEGYRDRNAKSWVYPTTFDRQPQLTSMDAGYLIQDLVA